MNKNFSPTVEKIVKDYLIRLKSHLRGLPEKDQEELTKEINSHIYESFMNDPTKNEIDRILNVFKKLGEPADVIAQRMSNSIVSMGKEKKLPLYIIAGVLIALVGIPLGLSGIGFLIGVVATVAALFLAYFITAIALVIAGIFGMAISIIQIVNPDFFVQFSDYFHFGFHIADPAVEGIIGLLISLLIAGLGVGLMLMGKYMIRGTKFLFNLTHQKIKEFRDKRRKY